ncbi:hypothetical protein [Dysgonomonas sp. BGC7]|uniref:hypothetical protein n=1 Tax=Dysgonomonas sp. BGC7 TaxID=1658008 RepID=UPI0006825978|nr:hypothetical protein [Dysgonomonas sp. BGC7]MBD8388209.1 hypothetical protein [Dysgonomonas sp. BGC7]
MIYEVKKDDIVLEIDDMVFFDKQPNEFRNMLNRLLVDNIAEFDNCLVILLETGRVIITEKEENNEI